MMLTSVKVSLDIFDNTASISQREAVFRGVRDPLFDNDLLKRTFGNETQCRPTASMLFKNL